MRRVLCINPTSRDSRELQHVHDHASCSCMYHSIADYTLSFDIEHSYTSLPQEIDRIIYSIEGMSIDGVFATNDYPGQIVSSIIAHELGLPGPDPDIILPLQDKYYARMLEYRVAPEATPAFETISAHNPRLQYVNFPCIIKPIKGVGSLGTMCIHNQEELDIISDVPATYLQPLYELSQAYSDYTQPEHSLLVEEFAPGDQVTVDGFVHNGAITIIGIVDCHVDPHTLQFRRFVYPSQLPETVQQRMRDTVTNLMRATQLNNTFFNVEMRYDDEQDRLTIIEINTRMSSQFADMYEKVDGYHPYDAAIDIACGQQPRIQHRQGTYREAHGICIHTDADYFVERTPSQDDIQEIQDHVPDIRIEIEASPGMRMSSCDNAIFVYGYTMLNIGGNHHDEIDDIAEYVRSKLTFTFSR